MATIDQGYSQEEEGGTPYMSSAGTTLGGYSAGEGQKRSSGQFTNLQKYADANKPQAERMGQRIGQDFDKERGEIGQGVQDLQSKFFSQYDPGTEDHDTFFKSLQSDPTQVDVNQAKGQVASINEKLADQNLQSAYDSEYSGLQNRAGQLQGAVGATNTQQGRREALRRIQQQGSTRGQGLLDQSLLRSSQGAQGMFEQQRQKSGGDTSAATQLASAQKASTDRFGEYKAAREANRGQLSGIEKGINPMQKTIVAMLKQRALEKRAAAELHNRQLLNDPANYGQQPTLPQLDVGGGSPGTPNADIDYTTGDPTVPSDPTAGGSVSMGEQQPGVFGTTVQGTLNAGVNVPYQGADLADVRGINAASVATPEDLARVNALRQVFGQGQITPEELLAMYGG